MTLQKTAPYTADTVTPQLLARHTRLRQGLLTFALALPVVAVIATAPPFEATPMAQQTPHMVGPNFPIIAGGERIVPIQNGNTITYTTKWTCGEVGANTFTMSNPDSQGRYRTLTRNLNGLIQTLNITTFTNGSPTQFTEQETRNGVVVNNSNVTLIDTNADGIYDAMSFTGQHNITLSFVYNGDNVSLPWAQMSAVGVDTNSGCAGDISQVYVPLADTNGDGRGDAIVWDLDGNGVADADMYVGAKMTVPSVPTMGPTARFILMALLAGVGSWFVSRRRPAAPVQA